MLARLPIDANIALLCDQDEVKECQMPEFEAVAEWIESITPESRSPQMPDHAHQAFLIQSKQEWKWNQKQR
jgi:hypothetical protein